MAKKLFGNLDKNINKASSLDDITSFGQVDPINEITNKQVLEHKNYPLKLPVTYHAKLKYKLSEKYDSSINDLIIAALEKAYPELLNKD